MVEDEHFTNIMQDRISALDTQITQSEKALSTNAKLLKNLIVKMVISSESSDDALTKFFNTEHNINEKLSCLKMKKMDLLYLRDNIKSLVITPKIITDLK